MANVYFSERNVENDEWWNNPLLSDSPSAEDFCVDYLIEKDEPMTIVEPSIIQPNSAFSELPSSHQIKTQNDERIVGLPYQLRIRERHAAIKIVDLSDENFSTYRTIPRIRKIWTSAENQLLYEHLCQLESQGRDALAEEVLEEIRRLDARFNPPINKLAIKINNLRQKSHKKKCLMSDVLATQITRASWPVD